MSEVWSTGRVSIALAIVHRDEIVNPDDLRLFGQNLAWNFTQVGLPAKKVFNICGVWRILTEKNAVLTQAIRCATEQLRVRFMLLGLATHVFGKNTATKVIERGKWSLNEFPASRMRSISYPTLAKMCCEQEAASSIRKITVRTFIKRWTKTAAVRSSGCPLESYLR